MTQPTSRATLKDYAKQNNIDYLKHKNVNSKEFISNIAKYNCDLFVSMSFDQIFKTQIINLPKSLQRNRLILKPTKTSCFFVNQIILI